MSTTTRWRERYRQAGRDAAFLLLSWPVLFVAFVLVTLILSFGASTAIIWVGVPIMVSGLYLASAFAELGRRAVAVVDHSEYLAGHYLQLQPSDTRLRRLLLPLRDLQRWLDALWVGVAFAIGTITWTVALIWATAATAGPIGPIAETLINRSFPDAESQNLAELLGLEPDLLWVSIIDLALGVFAILTAPYVLRVLVRLNQALTRALLCSRGQVERLQTANAAAQRAEADTRRALERDIHDGPQQRLVRLGMDLARAQRQLQRDPNAAGATIASAITQTQETLDELRRLSRGIAPPVLVDRGLAAALEELAARSAVQVQVDARLPRLPEHVEQVAYFVASEALANLNKHSGARAAQLEASVADGRLRLWVVDDGVGGADMAKGHGLAGLKERLDGVGGQLRLVSPAGGPTRVEAVIPCAF